MYYGDGKVYKVRVRNNDGKYVGKNQVVTFKINKKTYRAKTNKKGYASLKIPNTLKPGKYVISASYYRQTVKNIVKIKQVLYSAKTVKVKKSAKRLVLKATLKKGKVPLTHKPIKFRVNGKTYVAKTNKKGVAKAIIPKSAINKLKAGKKYTIGITYIKNTIKRTLRVRG